MKALAESRVNLHSGVKDAALRLAKATKAEAVVLFGSRARGDHSENSDWDLCVVLPDDAAPGKFNSVELWPLTAVPGESVEVYPLRKCVFEEKKSEVNTVSHDVEHDGVLIFGSV